MIDHILFVEIPANRFVEVYDLLAQQIGALGIRKRVWYGSDCRNPNTSATGVCWPFDDVNDARKARSLAYKLGLKATIFQET
jgi:hypothetical protein